MKFLVKFSICLGFVLLFASFANAQKTKTVTGYYCGQDSGGTGFSYPKLRVGKTVFEYTESHRGVKYVGMKKKNATKIGAEYIVKYYTEEGNQNWARSVTFTGRVKKIEPCSNE